MSWAQVAFDARLLPWLVGIGSVFGAVYGVHYGRVGHWVRPTTAPHARQADGVGLRA